jgi:hypothetical protein
MIKHKGATPRLAKVTRADGTVVVDVQTGLLVGVSADVERERTSSLTERRSQPPGDPTSKRLRN